jgi:isoquinoline 1-oxidoreductase beta subunit
MKRTSQVDITRRNLLKVSFAAGAGLMVGFNIFPNAGLVNAADKMRLTEKKILEPNAWIRISSDSTVTVVVNHSEMGQGITTALSMIVAEELTADWSKVKAEIAPAAAVYKNPAFGVQATGGSTSVETSWDILRAAGAATRELLVSAAAESWNVPVSECSVRNCIVQHKPSGETALYGQLLEKAAKMKIPESPQLKSANEFSLIGRRIPRLDSAFKARGRAVYGIDVQLPGLLNAAIVHAPVLGAELKSVDTSVAKSMPGVRYIVTLEYAVAVVADTFWQAHKAAEMLNIQWNRTSRVELGTQGIMRRWTDLIKTEGKVVRDDGDVSETIKKAVRKINAFYILPYQAHACPEPMNCTAHVRRDSCEIWVPTQAQGVAQDIAADICGLRLDKVQVHTTYLGGGFGRRGLSDFVAEAVQISKAVNAPVKLLWTREEDMRNDRYRPASYNLLEAGLDQNGLPTAWMHRAVGSAEIESIITEGAPAFLPAWLPRWIKNPVGKIAASLILRAQSAEDAMGGSATMVYGIENIRIEHVRDNPGVPFGAWRSVAYSRNGFVVESFMDEIAAASGLDPVELRMQLLKNAPRYRNVLRIAAEKSGWGKLKSAGVFQGVALQAFHNTPVAMVADISVSDNGRVGVHRVVCAVDCGTVINPKIVEAQMVSGIVFGLTATLKSSITVEKGRIQQSNFDDFPLLRMNEVPKIEVYIAASKEPPSGIGEAGVPPIAPAVTNALFAATGKRVRSLPLGDDTLAATIGGNNRV